MAQVGSGEVAIFPTFKGMRSAITREVDSSAQAASKGFRSLFSKTGAAAGADTGSGFRKAFDQQSKGLGASAVKQLESAVAKSARAVSAARLKEQDAAGKVRVAERQLAEARSKYASDSSQVVRAEERLATATRQLGAAQDNTKDATNELRSAQQRLAVAADRAGDELGEAGQRSAGKFASGFRQVLAGSFLGTAFANIAGSIASSVQNAIGDGVRAAWNYVQDSVGFASGLEQSLGAVDAVFKDSASTIHGWARAAAQAVGLSQSKYNEFATVVGAQLKNMGIPMDEVAGKTGDLISLGSDLAAQFGGSTSDAVGALSSLLRGERDPIERYGVSIKEVDVAARAAAMGLEEAYKAGDKNAAMQATLALLYEQTRDAQGTFAREAETLAGQQARLTAEWENAQTKLGMSLIPALTTLASTANESLVPVLNEVIERVGPQLGDALADATPALVDLVEAVADSLPDLIELGTEALPLLIEGARVLLPLLQAWVWWQGSIPTALNSLLGLLRGDTSIEEFGDKVAGSNTMLGWLARTLAEGTRGITEWAFAVGRTAADAVQWFQNKVGEVTTFVQQLPQRAVEALGNVGATLFASGRALIQGFIDGIGSMLGAAGDAVNGVLDWVSGFFPHSPAKRGVFAGAGWEAVGRSGGALMKQWASGMSSAAFAVPVGTAAAPHLASAAAGTASAAAGITQHNYFDHMDPAIAVELAGQTIAVYARRGGA